jgi:hypothetical protein
VPLAVCCQCWHRALFFVFLAVFVYAVVIPAESRKYLGAVMATFNRPHGYRLLACVTLAAALLAPRVVCGQEQYFTFGDIRVAASTDQSGVNGYGAFTFVVSNNSATTTHQVSLKIPKNSYRSDLRSMSHDVTVKPQSQQRIRMWQPHLNMQGNGLEVTVDGVVTSEPYGWSFNFSSGDFRNVVVAAATQFPQRGEIHQAISQIPWKPTLLQSGQQPGLQQSGQQLGLQWVQPFRLDEDNYLGWARFDGVAITAKEFRGLSGPVQTALLRYVECGGSLLIAGKWLAPPSWQLQKKSVGRLVSYSVGFGECMVVPEEDYNWQKPVPPAVARHIAESWARSARMEAVSATEANQAFPVIEDVEVPVRGLFLVMLGFGIVIGPVNLYVLSRKKRRLWLLATVPLIALVTCLAVSSYMALTEPWGSHVRTASVTFLDETTGRAATLANLGLYSSVAPADGLHFDKTTELTPLWLTHTQRQMPGVRTIDWTVDQHLNSGWLPPRMPVHFLLRRSDTRKERVRVSNNAAGKRSVVNGLPSALRSFHVADAEGKIYAAHQVPAGGEAILEAAGTCRPAGSQRSLRDFCATWLIDMVPLTANPGAFLVPGCYVAVLDDAPFVEEGLRGASDRRGQSVVYGILKEPLP